MGRRQARKMTTKKNILRLEDLTMQFGGVVAVNNLNVEVNEGEIVALIGPNGAGKTTAFNCVTGVYEPTNGRISLNGEVIAESFPQGKMKTLYKGENAGRYTKQVQMTPDKITYRGIARTFQNVRLFKALTVFENVMIAKHMRAKHNVFTATFRLNAKEEKRMREESMALLEEQNLAHLSNSISSSLPYGLQRRLEIARALATDPTLLLLDEPAAGMNPQETDELADFIRQTRDRYKLTIFLIEHHMDLVMKISERIYVLDFGKLISHGNPDEVRSDKKVIEAYLGVVEEDADD
jgi:branched-chain amino acid transport system ATP-binding protein